MKTIELFRENGCWMLRCKNYLDDFGCADVLTAFTASDDEDFVLDCIKALNPDCNIMLISE